MLAWARSRFRLAVSLSDVDVCVFQSKAAGHVRGGRDWTAEQVDCLASEGDMTQDEPGETVGLVVKEIVSEVRRPVIVKHGDHVESPLSVAILRASVPPALNPTMPIGRR